MGMIDDFTVRRIKEAADIVAVASDFLQLKRAGSDYKALCPFHDDRHMGSFVISRRKNICTCFACGVSYDAAGFLMHYGQGMKYGEALRWLANKFGIAIEGEKPMHLAPAPRREPLPELPTVTFPLQWVAERAAGAVGVENPLVTWLEGLPWSEEQRKRLDYWIEMYAVGTSNAPDTLGWTIWWQVDEQRRVRTGKLMKYGPDGHRDKNGYSFNFIHSMMRKAGRWSDKDHEARTCLFGLHMLNDFPDAQVCIVESEKSALIAQMFTREGSQLFMATGSKSGLTIERLQPLIDANRWVYVYPDADGVEEWKRRVDAIKAHTGFNRIRVADKAMACYDPELDGPKADIADILIRQLTHKSSETPEQRLARMSAKNPAIETLAKALQPTNITTTNNRLAI